VNLRNLWKVLLFSSLRQKEQKTLYAPALKAEQEITEGLF